MYAQTRKNYVAEGVRALWSLCNTCLCVLVFTSGLGKRDFHKHSKHKYLDE